MTAKESAEKAVRDIRRKTRRGSHRRAQRRVPAPGRFVLANRVEIAGCLMLRTEPGPGSDAAVRLSAHQRARDQVRDT